MALYDAFAQTFSRSRTRLQWPELDAIIATLRKNGHSRVLDLGCGNGRFLDFTDSLAIDYFGIDNSTAMMDAARGLHPGYQFAVGDIRSLGEVSEIQGLTYDAIVLLASFHHLESHEERVSVLSDIKKYLKKDGILMMTNWNLQDQPRYKKSHQGNGDYAIKIGEFSRYYHGFTLGEISNLAHEAGYQIIENQIFKGGRNILTQLIQ